MAVKRYEEKRTLAYHRMVKSMDAGRKSWLDWIIGWFASSGESTDRDFDGWVSNDPMVTLDPASRYGDDATGFLAGGESENPELGGKDE